MNTATTYRGSARRDAAIADDYLANHLPCRQCKALSERDTLTAMGGLCRGCYGAWCTAGNPPDMRRTTSAQRIAALQGLRASLGASKTNPRQWALDLRAREVAGEVLSKAQALAWRKALRAADQEAGDDLGEVAA